MAQVNKDAQKPDVVLKSMRRARKAAAIAATRQLAPILGQATKRGEMMLSMMTDSEWERLNVSISAHQQR
jgi:hypothetical protein